MLGHRVVKSPSENPDLSVIAVTSIIAPIAVRIVPSKKGKNIVICMSYDKVCRVGRLVSAS